MGLFWKNTFKKKNKMDKAEKKRLIEDVLRVYKDMNDTWNSMNDVLGYVTDSPVGNASWKAFDKYVQMTSLVIGDEGEWISWFVFENECGNKAGKVKVNGKEKAIKTVSDLLLVIGG